MCVAGFLLLSPALVAILHGLSRAVSVDGFASIDAFAPLAAGSVLAAGYLIHSFLRPGRSLVELRLFAIRSFATAGGVLFSRWQPSPPTRQRIRRRRDRTS
jgi:hypothetical protein